MNVPPTTWKESDSPQSKFYTLSPKESSRKHTSDGLVGVFPRTHKRFLMKRGVSGEELARIQEDRSLDTLGGAEIILDER